MPCAAALSTGALGRPRASAGGLGLGQERLGLGDLRTLRVSLRGDRHELRVLAFRLRGVARELRRPRRAIVAAEPVGLTLLGRLELGVALRPAGRCRAAARRGALAPGTIGPGVTGCLSVASSRSAAARMSWSASSLRPSARAIHAGDQQPLNVDLICPVAPFAARQRVPQRREARRSSRAVGEVPAPAPPRGRARRRGSPRPAGSAPTGSRPGAGREARVRPPSTLERVAGGDGRDREGRREVRDVRLVDGGGSGPARRGPPGPGRAAGSRRPGSPRRGGGRSRVGGSRRGEVRIGSTPASGRARVKMWDGMCWACGAAGAMPA